MKNRLIGTVYDVKDGRTAVIEDVFVELNALSIGKSMAMIKFRFLENKITNIPQDETFLLTMETFESVTSQRYSSTPDFVLNTTLSLQYRVKYAEFLNNRQLDNGSWMDYT